MSTPSKCLRRFVLLAAVCAVALPLLTSTSSARYCPPNGRPCTGDVPFFTGNGGGVGAIAGRHANICAHNRIEPGGSAPATIGSYWTQGNPKFGVNDGSESGTLAGVLVCAPLLDIWGHTTGPGADGVSIDCAARGMRPLESGAGYSVTPHEAVSQVHGGFGHGKDGYWHYRFHNSNHQTVEIQFWAVCTPH